MLAAERRKIIIEQLQADKNVVVAQLAALFDVSGETIRRDLELLCQEGIATKSHGGAVLNEHGMDLPFAVRKHQRFAEKRLMADIIEGLVSEGDSIMLDASTTAVFVAKALKRKKRLTVITNSIDVMVELAEMRDWTLIVTGGKMVSDYLAITGAQAVNEIAGYSVDKLIFSCKGLDIERGIFEGNDDFAQLKRAMIASARVRILAADGHKFGRAALAKVGELSDVDTVVTDAKPDAAWLAAFAAQGVRCLH